jgi:protein-S-isoprenylcysteine O-methyltransferase Ste14
VEWMPAFQIGWLNGWILLALLVLTDGVLFLSFPKPVVARLFDRSGWSQKQGTLTVLSKLCALFCIVSIVLTPLKIGSPVFIAGIILVALGLVGLVKAVLDFRHTPLDQPVVRGLYRISRHPQIVMSSVVILGACLAIGSGAAVIAFAGAKALGHYGILAEEEVCLRQYGDDYRAYLQRVPRYFVFF